MYKDKKCKMVGCESTFTPTSGIQKYCVDCKEKAKIEREKTQWKKQSRKRSGSIEYIRNCLACNKKFSTFYKKKIYCGDPKCEVERIRVKNKRIHKGRSKEKLIDKGRKYYKNNREICLLKKAKDYRKKYPNAKNYISGRTPVHNIAFVKEYVEQYGYKLLSTSYTNNKAPIELECPRGHYWKTSLHNFKDYNARCFTCSTRYNRISKFETEVREFVNKVYSGKIIYNDRTIVFNSNTNRFLELDLYFPELNKAIECDGIYWHSTDIVSVRDRVKTKFCNDNDIDLLRINDDEWPSENCRCAVCEFLY